MTPTGEMLIVGRLRARLLGLPLLTIDVHVAVGPEATMPTPIHVTRSAGRRRWGVPRRPLRPRTSGPTDNRRRPAPTDAAIDRGGRPPRSDDIRLARSAQLVREATAVLEELGAP